MSQTFSREMHEKLYDQSNSRGEGKGVQPIRTPGARAEYIFSNLRKCSRARESARSAVRCKRGDELSVNVFNNHHKNNNNNNNYINNNCGNTKTVAKTVPLTIAITVTMTITIMITIITTLIIITITVTIAITITITMTITIQ